MERDAVETEKFTLWSHSKIGWKSCAFKVFLVIHFCSIEYFYSQLWLSFSFRLRFHVRKIEIQCQFHNRRLLMIHRYRVFRDRFACPLMSIVYSLISHPSEIHNIKQIMKFDFRIKKREKIHPSTTIHLFRCILLGR